MSSFANTGKIWLIKLSKAKKTSKVLLLAMFEVLLVKNDVAKKKIILIRLIYSVQC